MQIKIESICHSNIHGQKTLQKNSLDSKYRSMKYMSTKILMSNPPNKQASMQYINKSDVNNQQNNNPIVENNEKIRINKIKSLMQPAFVLRVQSKLMQRHNTNIKKQRVIHLLQLNKRTLQLKSKQQQKLKQLAQQQGQQAISTQKDIEEGVAQDEAKKRKISQILSKFIQNKLQTNKSVYLGTSHTSMQRSFYCANSKLKAGKTNERSETTLKNKNKLCSANQRHKTEYHDVILIDDQLKKQSFNKDKPHIKKQANSKQRIKMTHKLQQNNMMNSFMQTKTRYENQSKAKNNEMLQQHFQKQKEMLKQNSSSIIRKNCLYLSSYLKLRCKKTLQQQNEEQKDNKKEVAKFQSEGTISSTWKGKQPHIGGSHSIQKFNPNKQYYLKLRQQSMKKKSLVTHYSKSNITRRNEDEKQRQSNTNRKRSKQYSIGCQKPNITIDPW